MILFLHHHGHEHCINHCTILSAFQVTGYSYSYRYTMTVAPLYVYVQQLLQYSAHP